MSRIAAAMERGVLIPAQAMISPRFAIVEYAKTLLPVDWLTASADVAKKVNAPAIAMTILRYVPA